MKDSDFVRDLSAIDQEIQERNEKIEEEKKKRTNLKRKIERKWEEWAKTLLSELEWEPFIDNECKLRIWSYSPPEVTSVMRERGNKKIVRFGGKFKFVFKQDRVEAVQVGEEVCDFLIYLQRMNINYDSSL